jgi:anti-sigma regulatory factor (Ser/Thr protein kinase)
MWTLICSKSNGLNRWFANSASCTMCRDGLFYAINLAIDELVSNIVLHGYEDPNGKQITVQIEGSAANCAATITDAGREFNPTDVPRPDSKRRWKKRTWGVWASIWCAA